MKLFWGSIVFISVACFAPLAFGANVTQWTLNQSNNVFNSAPTSTGVWNVAGNWSNGVPSGAPGGTTAELTVNNFEYISFYGNINSNNTLTITVPSGQSAQAINFQDDGLDASGPGSITLNLQAGSTFTISGINTVNNNSITVTGEGDTLTSTINGGTVIVQTGNTTVGDTLGTNDTLIFQSTTVTYTGSNAIPVGPGPTLATTGIFVGAGTITGSTTGQVGTLIQNNATVNGSSFVIQVGTGGGTSGNYVLQNGSALNLSTSSTGFLSRIQIGGGGSMSIDSSSTLTLNGGSILYVGDPLATTQSAGTASVTTAGNINGNGGVINVGTGGTSGLLTQTGGSIGGSMAITVGAGTAGSGSYVITGGNAAFTNGFVVANGAGSNGTVSQTGGTLTVGPGVTAIFGVGGGTATYALGGGSADFQGGFHVGTGSTISMSGASTLSSEGDSIIRNGGNFVMGGSNATFNSTLEIQTGGNLNLNSGTMQIAENNLSGGGSLNLGGGYLKLTNGPDTTYSNPLFGNLTAGQSTIDVSATGITTFNFQKLVTGPGGITLIGNGNTNFYYTADANYSGMTSILAGVLNITNQNDIMNSSSVNLGSGGYLNLTISSGGFQYNNGISGPGTLLLNYTTAGDSFVMPNANNFTGKIVLGADGANAGNVQLFNGSYSDISENAAGSTVTIGGPSAIPASAPVPTSGTVTFTGNNTYTGDTNINPGFTVRASNFTGSVNNSGNLGTLGSLLSPGQLSIGGNLNSNGTLQYWANGQTADKYVVAGTSQLSGIINVVGSGTKTYTAVATGGGLTIGGNGMLNNAGGLNTNPALTLFSSFLTADGNNLYVNTVQQPLIGFVTTPQQKAYANAIDPFTQTPPIVFSSTLTALDAVPASEVAAAVQQLTPQGLQYAPLIGFENSMFLVSRLNGALGDLRTGYSGLDTNGISFAEPGFENGTARSLSGMLASNAPDFHTTAPNGVNYYPDGGGTAAPPSSDIEPAAPTSRMTPADAASPTTYNGQVMSDSPVPMHTSASPTLRSSRFGEFVSGDVVLANLNPNPNSMPTVSYTAGDIMAGVSYRMTSNLSLGVLFDYNHTNADTDSYGSKTIVNAYTPGVFATFFEKGFYANGLFAFGFNQYENTRNITMLGPANGTASSSPSGQQYTADLDLGYDFHPDKEKLWTVGPTLGLTYTHLNIDAYSESGMPADDYNVASQSVDSFRTRLGGHLEYLARVGNVALQPNIMAAWQHEYINDNSGLNVALQNIPTGTFTSPFVNTAADSGIFGCGLTATLDNSFAFYLNYMGDINGDGFFAQSIIAGVKGSF
jgi:uncharacterized protein YhjY with autotransporter beta-barrel domain